MAAPIRFDMLRNKPTIGIPSSRLAAKPNAVSHQESRRMRAWIMEGNAPR